MSAFVNPGYVQKYMVGCHTSNNEEVENKTLKRVIEREFEKILRGAKGAK